jgi:CheY-like chemotaxis protein
MKGSMDTQNPPQRVLVVDDEPLICWSIAQTLNSGGDIVSEARTGEEAIRALRDANDSPDVVLLDYSLPDVDDLSLLATLRCLSPRTRIIVMSVYYTDEMATKALALGAARVVSKPIDMQDVPALVHPTPRLPS